MQQRILFDRAAIRRRWLDPLVNAERLAGLHHRGICSPGRRPGRCWRISAAAGGWDRGGSLTGQTQRPADAADAEYRARFMAATRHMEIVRTTAEWELPALAGAGRYAFSCSATAGTPLLVRGVTLQVEDHTGRRRTISSDDHQGYARHAYIPSAILHVGIAGRQSDAARHYLVADMLGYRPTEASSWENTRGTIYFKREQDGRHHSQP